MNTREEESFRDGRARAEYDRILTAHGKEVMNIREQESFKDGRARAEYDRIPYKGFNGYNGG
jgi:hypothetical protein